LVQWRVANFNKPERVQKHPLDWNLPYEMIIAAVADANVDGEE